VANLGDKISAARIAIGHGLALFLVHGIGTGGACACGDPACNSPGKHPVGGGWQSRATHDATVITEQLTVHPTANVGIATGPCSGVFVLDVDPRHDGDKSLEALETVQGRLPETLTCNTGGGGTHLFFRLPQCVVIPNSVGKIGAGLDVKAGGGFVVAAGSAHSSGADYAWKDQAASISEAPRWLVDLAVARPPTGQHVIPFTPGRRNTDVLSLAGWMRNKGATHVQIEAATKALNDTLPEPLPEDEIEDIARRIVLKEPSILSDLTDRSVSGMLATRVREAAAYCPELGWLHYEDGRWANDPEGLLIQESAKELVCTIESQAKLLASGMEDRSGADRLIKAAKKCQSASFVRNIVRLSASDPQLLTPIGRFDSDPNCFNVRNGTLDLRVRLRMELMTDPTQEEAAHGDVDHGLGDVDAGFVVAHEASPAGQPAEGALDDPAPRQDFEARLGVEAADDLNDEVEEGSLVQEPSSVIGPVGEQMLDPGPALADGVEDRLGARAVGDVGRGEIDHQEAAVGVDDDMPLAADDLLAGVVASRFGRRCLHCLAVGDARRRAGLAARTLAVHHQRDVMDGAEQQQTHEPPKPPVDRLPGRKVLGQHAPAAAAACHIADRVQNLAQINLGFAPALRRPRQQRPDVLPLSVRQVRGVALDLLLDGGNTAARLWGPHPQLESRRPASLQAFSNGL
jgi:bifunctional DNA primase/polymerase-like protein/D5-like protein/primase-like protein